MCVRSLAEILDDNPFLGVQDEWRRRLAQTTGANLAQLSAQRFVLPYDEHNDAFNAEVRAREEEDLHSKLRLEFLPVPFIGSPEADTWYVQINPGVSDLDYYDMFSVSPEIKSSVCSLLAHEERSSLQDKLTDGCRKGMLQDRLDELRHRIDDCTSASFVLDGGDDENERLEERKRLLIDQLDLRNATSVFYPLKRCFRTLVASPNERRLSGSYRWWKSALCIGNGDALFAEVFADHAQGDELTRYDTIANELGNHLFVMEFYPYHSSSFDRMDSYSEGHPYLAFVREMLQYAQANGKRIIFRSRNDIVEMMGTHSMAHHVLGNPYRVYLTTSGLINVG